jgi:hypothetical protein
MIPDFDGVKGKGGFSIGHALIPLTAALRPLFECLAGRTKWDAINDRIGSHSLNYRWLPFSSFGDGAAARGRRVT